LVAGIGNSEPDFLISHRVVQLFSDQWRDSVSILSLFIAYSYYLLLQLTTIYVAAIIILITEIVKLWPRLNDWSDRLFLDVLTRNAIRSSEVLAMWGSFLHSGFSDHGN
jgi:hypothetical protein